MDFVDLLDQRLAATAADLVAAHRDVPEVPGLGGGMASPKRDEF